jgi:putative ABC transport system permease protein
MLQDYKLGLRMLVKFPGLTIAGGLALAIAIGIGAAWYDVTGKILSPTIPLPEGDRLVLIATQNTLTNQPEMRLAGDFLEWRRELRTIEELGAYRTDTRNLIVGNAAPEPIRLAELTSTAFRAARVSPLLGRALLDSDDVPGAPTVVVLAYDVWQRALGGRRDVVGLVVRLGHTSASVVGVMPDGFRYPINHHAWTPLQLRASYGALEGNAISVIGRLAPGVTFEGAEAEVRVLTQRAAAALPATHEHLRSRVVRPGQAPDTLDIANLAITNLPGLLILLVACLTVGTLVYARTATREGEIALRSALGASRARIVAQLFIEAFVLSSIAAVVGLVAADRALRWGIGAAFSDEGGAPFWMAGGLKLTTIVYASGLALVAAGLLSVLPALKATRARVQSNLANLGTGSATLRFGRVWTTAMIAQIALTGMGIPVAIENASQAMRRVSIRAAFPSGNHFAARIDVDRSFDRETTSAFEERRAQMLTRLERRLAQEPGVVAMTFADVTPGTLPRRHLAEIASPARSTPAYSDRLPTSAVGPGFFEAFDRPIVAGRAFHQGDHSPTARTVIVNEAFARDFQRNVGGASPIGARLRYAPSPADEDQDDDGSRPFAAASALTSTWFEIVGVVRDFGLDPEDDGSERAYVFHPASAGTVSPFVIIARVRGNPAALSARLPVVANDVDASLFVREARPLDEWIRLRDMSLIVPVGAHVAVTALVLFLSALGIFSLMSVSVSRRTREIGLRTALGANPRQVLTGILSHAVVVMGSGIAAGGALLLWGAALAGPTGRPAEDVAQFSVWLAITATVLAVAGLLACIGPARRALRISPTEALREA